MKWTTTTLSLAITTLICGSLWGLEGGGCTNGACIVAPSYPFYGRTHSIGCPAYLHVYSPTDGTTYYTNNILLNLTSDALNCRYKVVGPYLWNTIPCTYENVLTWPGGNVQIQVEATTGSCTYQTTLDFVVRAFHGIAVGEVEYPILALLWGGGIGLLAWGVYLRRRKPPKNTTFSHKRR